jgi:hypothetical protein
MKIGIDGHHMVYESKLRKLKDVNISGLTVFKDTLEHARCVVQPEPDNLILNAYGMGGDVQRTVCAEGVY